MPKDIEFRVREAGQEVSVSVSVTEPVLPPDEIFIFAEWFESFFLPAGDPLVLPRTTGEEDGEAEGPAAVSADLPPAEEEGDIRPTVPAPALLSLVTAEVKGMQALAGVPIATFSAPSPALPDDTPMAALPMPASCICSFCGASESGGYMAAESPYENGSGTGIDLVGLTGFPTLDGVIWGSRWNTSSISYSDTDSFADYQAAYFFGGVVDGYQIGFGQLSAAQLRVVHTALNSALYTQNAGALGLSVEAFTNLKIDYTGPGSGAATLRLANTLAANLPTARVADFPEANIWGGDVWFGGSGITDLVAGSYHWHTVIHELGHALGLKHGHSTTNRAGGGAPALPLATDSMEYSVMTYRSYVGAPTGGYTNEQYGYAQTWMMYDIAALQFLYGADYSANSGDTTYTWTPGSGNTVINGQVAIAPGANRIFATIWDGGGIDTYDLSAYSTDLTISLVAGGHSVFSAAQLADLDQFSSSSARIARGNIFNALLFNGNTASLIENAIGGSGNDSLLGNQVANTLRGGAGVDTLFGGAGSDVLYGGDAEDSAFGGSGNDRFINHFGELADNVYGGDGNDTLDCSGRTDAFAVYVNELTAHYSLVPTFAPTFVYEMVSIERYIGTSHNDTFQSGGDGNTFFGGMGDDTMIAGAGGETMYGGGGNDTLDLSVGNFVYTFNTETGLSTQYSSFELFLGFETFIFGAANDTITTHSFLVESETVYGGAGNDKVIDLTNFSSLYLDAYYGGAGIDEIEFSSSALTALSVINLLAGRVQVNGQDRDIVSGFENARVIDNSAGMIGTNGDNLLTAVGTGNNSISGLGGNDSLFGDGGNDSIDGGIGNDSLFGGDGVDQMSGGNGNDTLFGQAGDDILIGSFGVDYMNGGSGNDIYYYENLGDVIVENGAGDTADRILSSISANIALIDIDIENMTLTGTGNINGVGSNIANEIVGNVGNNQLSGDGGNDTLKGGDGDDILNGNDGDDLLVGGNGNDSLIGQIGTDRLEGGAGNDSMAGFGGNDSLIGGAGNDRIDGGAGDDRISGGADADTFVFIGNWGVDVITDFSTTTAEERIDLSAAPGITSFADLTANHLTQVGPNAVITSGANTITIAGVNIALLDADDFIF